MSSSIGFDIYAKDRASKVIDNVGDSAEASGGKLSKFGKIAKVGAAGVVAVGVAALGAGKYLFDHAAKLEQMGAKAETVFGKSLGMVDNWSKKNAHAMGLTTREATGLAANFGDLLIPMGFARKEAAKMSTDVVGLSGALSQWSGGTKSAAEVSEILSAAMLGETDGLKSLGIAISAADIEARLAAKGQKDLTGSARQQAEAQAIQALIMEKSTDAQKKYAEGGSPLLSAQNKLTAIFKESRDELAVKLIPAFVKGAEFMVNKVVPAIGKVSSYLKDKLGPTFSKIGGFITKELVPTLRDLAGKWLKGVQGMFENIGKSVEENRPFLEAVGEALKAVAKVAGGALKKALGFLYEHGFPLLGTAIGKGIWVVKKLVTGFLFLGEYGIKSFRFLLNGALNTFGGILSAAEKGLGWVPKLGDKIKSAKRSFDDFRSSTITNLDKTAAKLREVRDKINGVKSPPPVKIAVNSNVSDTTNKLAGLLQKIKDINGETMTIYVNTLTKGNAPKTNTDLYGLPTNARGTSFWRGGVTLVGEEGPEIVNLPRGSRIHSAQESRNMAAPAGGAMSEQDWVRLLVAVLSRLRLQLVIKGGPNDGQLAYLQGA